MGLNPIYFQLKSKATTINLKNNIFYIYTKTSRPLLPSRCFAPTARYACLFGRQGCGFNPIPIFLIGLNRRVERSDAREVHTPEIKGHTEEEKQVAKETRDILSNEILHRVVFLKNVQTDKYGRILADVYLDDLHINKWLIDNKFAVEYDGGKKQEFQKIIL